MIDIALHIDDGYAGIFSHVSQVFIAVTPITMANGDAVFIGREGDIVNRRYKILRIQSNQVEIEDVLNNNRQTIPLTQG